MMINRIKAEFNNCEIENSYRNNYLTKDANQARLALVFCAVPLVLFSISDYLLFGWTAGFFYLIFARIIMLFSLLGMIIFLKISKSYRLNDAVIFIFWLIITGGIFYIYSTRPHSFSPYAVYDIIMILSVYLLLPNRFVLQLIPAIIYTIVTVAFLIRLRSGVESVLVLRIILSLLFANILGIFLSWRLHYLNRSGFAALKKEKELSAALDSALKNVKTLSGLLPICSRCHKIRNDEGYWKSIEHYVEEHSDAQFTHSLCSDCMEHLYSDEDWYIKSKLNK